LKQKVCGVFHIKTPLFIIQAEDTLDKVSAITIFGLIAPIVVIAISLITPRATTPMANATPNAAPDVLPATTPMANIDATGLVDGSLTPVATPVITPTPAQRTRGRGNRHAYSEIFKIEIDDMDNKVKYMGFEKGDPWNIKLLNTTTSALTYEFNNTIGEMDTDGKNWSVWFGYVLGKEGMQYCISPGSYFVYAKASHNGILTENNGGIAVNSSEACGSPIPPVSEMSTMLLTFTGLIMTLLIYLARKRDG